MDDKQQWAAIRAGHEMHGGLDEPLTETEKAMVGAAGHDRPIGSDEETAEEMSLSVEQAFELLHLQRNQVFSQKLAQIDARAEECERKSHDIKLGPARLGYVDVADTYRKVIAMFQEDFELAKTRIRNLSTAERLTLNDGDGALYAQIAGKRATAIVATPAPTVAVNPSAPKQRGGPSAQVSKNTVDAIKFLESEKK
jgi:hypothetical protein